MVKANVNRRYNQVKSSVRRSVGWWLAYSDLLLVYTLHIFLPYYMCVCVYSKRLRMRTYEDFKMGARFLNPRCHFRDLFKVHIIGLSFSSGIENMRWSHIYITSYKYIVYKWSTIALTIWIKYRQINRIEYGFIVAAQFSMFRCCVYISLSSFCFITPSPFPDRCMLSFSFAIRSV